VTAGGTSSATIRLGNDLVRQFRHLPREHAAEQIGTHILKFWEPRMRHELLARIRLGDLTLEPLLVAAAEHLVDGETDDAEVAQPSGG
jgi:formate dehydrogenase subunit delta